MYNYVFKRFFLQVFGFKALLFYFLLRILYKSDRKFVGKPKIEFLTKSSIIKKNLCPSLTSEVFGKYASKGKKNPQKLVQFYFYIYNTSVIHDLIKFTTHFWLFEANFKLCTIGSSMSVIHKGTVYSERRYGKKATICRCLLDFLVHFNI